ncbi:MAG: hypothetical protein GXP30_03580 [Verrucomicrobia bacterium]|nr:hypothetical protein [Verrucomicrobiota bacterium]
MKKKLLIFIGIVSLLMLGLLILSRESILENWRMRKVAKQLEASVAIREAYGSNVSVISLVQGPQGGASMHTKIYHITPFRVLGNGVDVNIDVKWSHWGQDLEVDVAGFSEDGSYIDSNGTLK